MTTLQETNVAMENGPCIDELSIEDGDFPVAMLNYQRAIPIVTQKYPK